MNKEQLIDKLNDQRSYIELTITKEIEESRFDFGGRNPQRHVQKLANTVINFLCENIEKLEDGEELKALKKINAIQKKHIAALESYIDRMDTILSGPQIIKKEDNQ
jgi:ATP-dependent RNA circularization protein (DNA/RNA ligase family)